MEKRINKINWTKNILKNNIIIYKRFSYRIRLYIDFNVIILIYYFILLKKNTN